MVGCGGREEVHSAHTLILNRLQHLNNNTALLRDTIHTACCLCCVANLPGYTKSRHFLLSLFVEYRSFLMLSRTNSSNPIPTRLLSFCTLLSKQKIGSLVWNSFRKIFLSFSLYVPFSFGDHPRAATSVHTMHHQSMYTITPPIHAHHHAPTTTDTN